MDRSGDLESFVRAGRDVRQPRNVFVIGLNDFNRAKLSGVSAAGDCWFHPLLEEPHDYDVASLLRQAEAELRAFDGPVDVVVGYTDFPVSAMLPILCRRLGLPAASLESVLKCEHKYWARREQAAVVPDHIPRFALFDPFDPQGLDRLALDFPFWIKPIKSSGSFLGFRVPDVATFERSVAEIRRHIGEISAPFDFVLEQADLPPEIAGVPPHACIAESLISGRQCTLEGFVFDGDFETYGVIDSLRVGNGSSFKRYEYPSRLPRSVHARMAEIASRVVRRVGLQRSAFNVEFFWDRREDRVWLLEVNPRVAQHHSDLFEKVDGVSNHEVATAVAPGRRPEMLHRRGRFACAGTFFYRIPRRDAVVLSVPDAASVAALERRFPGTFVQVQVAPGMRLSDLHEQDSYTCALALLYVGAASRRQLLDRWRSSVQALEFRLASSDGAGHPYCAEPYL